MAINNIEISGVVISRNADYALLKSRRNSGAVDFIRLWDLPYKVCAGSYITVLGELECSLMYKKSILGIRVYDVKSWNGKHKAQFLGTIVSKSQIRATPRGWMILELTVKVNDKSLIPVIVWNDLAYRVNALCNVGDDIKVIGLLFSRKYNKFQHGRYKKKMTTEINAKYIKKRD